MVHVVSVADERNRFESPSAGLAGDAWAEREHERAEAAVRETAAGLPDVVRTETAVIEGIPTRQSWRTPATPALTWW